MRKKYLLLFLVLFITMLGGCTQNNNCDLTLVNKQISELHKLYDDVYEETLNNKASLDAIVIQQDNNRKEFMEDVYSDEIKKARKIMNDNNNYGYCEIDGAYDKKILYFNCETKYSSTYRIKVDIIKNKITLL